MLGRLAVATLLLILPGAASAQSLSVLHIKVVLLDAEQKATPVPRHALLISDNPATAAPRLIITAMDGTADVRLRPGNYTVESDQPVAFQGNAYQWTQTLDVPAGRDTVLELTTGNAEVEALTAATTASATPLEADPSGLLLKWQDSVVALWTATTRGSGFVIDARGLIATNQRVVGSATSVEVQFTPAIKVAGSVLVADAARDVSIIRIDPKALGSVRPVGLGCVPPPKPPLAEGQRIFTIGAPLREPKSLAAGMVSRVEAQATASDWILAQGSTGGPVFTAAGDVVGISSVADDKEENRRGRSRVVGIAAACDVVASAEKKVPDGPAPSGALLPVEPVAPFPKDALKEGAQRRAGSLNPYQTSASDFEIAFITPVQAYGAQQKAEQAMRSERSGGSPRVPDAAAGPVRPLTDFGNWSDYVADFPAVLLVRVTPKLVEGFWTTVARGAAQTQGVSLPPMKRFKSSFLRMRALCGEAEVTPIHAFRLEPRVPDSNPFHEGLYVFDPSSLEPRCGTVKLVIYSEKEPEKGDSRIVDPKVVEQIWQDFTPYRAVK